MKREVVLGYHSIDTPVKEPGGYVYCVSLEKFREQMKFVSEFSGSRVNALSTPMRQHTNRRTISVSFDDGDFTNYVNAYPVLKEFGLKAFFFILVGRVGTAAYMNWQHITELRNAGMIIGSHGMTHRILTELNDKELNYELSESKRILEEKLGQPIENFSIPRGFYNRKIIEIAKNTGYKRVFTSNLKNTDGFKFGRISVKADWDLEYFVRVLKKGLPFTHAAKEFLKNTSKKLLGTKIYDRLRTKVLGEKATRSHVTSHKK